MRATIASDGSPASPGGALTFPLGLRPRPRVRFASALVQRLPRCRADLIFAALEPPLLAPFAKHETWKFQRVPRIARHQPLRLAHHSMKPFEPRALHPNGRPCPLASEEIDRRADT